MATSTTPMTTDEVLPALHAVPAQFGYLTTNISPGGVLLGSTASRGEVLVDLIRPVPTRVTLLGEDAWLARLLTIRLAEIGVGTVVATDRATAWEYFVNVIGGQRPIAAVRTDHASPLPAPSVGSPLVVLEDTRDVPPETYAPRMAWQTTIHVRAGLNERSRNLLDASHAVLICRLPGDAANAISAALGLGANGPATVQTLGEFETLLIADRRAHRVSVAPTPTERRML